MNSPKDGSLDQKKSYGKNRVTARNLGQIGAKRDRATEAYEKYAAGSDGEAEPQDGLKCEQLSEVSVLAQPTPNPNALKFVLNREVKREGYSTYRSPVECGENPLGRELFAIRGVDQIHFFENTITVTKFSYEEWESIEGQIMQTIQKHMPQHDPDYYDPDPEAERRAGLSEELKKIEGILDKTVRPGLQADGGDIMALSYENHVLMVKYAGACGTCPSATTGTLYAIKSILQEQFDPEIEVFIAPQF